MKKPVIAFTCSQFQSIFVKLALRLAIYLAGGKPLYISSDATQDDTQILPDFDGLLLGGGADIHPKLYDGKIKPNYRYDEARDALELRLLEHVFASDKPVLGICRGCQMLNIFQQGTLYEDLKKLDSAAQYPNHLLGYIFFRKRIKIVQDSRLYQCIGHQQTKVNSIHKQCINLVGDGFNVTASEENKIIQCIEHTQLTFAMGVQFHPEFLIMKKPFFNIFKLFVRKSRCS
ncbi:MAG: gamma-glutamyl-gamma-aminobutyrate hydrolase family protein [Legionellaceae bacterium]|nr:gamma-glutamyl-gamma-aminobutyrate hydrolase family protein [Legionellaceae bacterium]